MSSQTEHGDGDLVKEILAYFLRHPQSADTLEGVARWRLLEEAIHRALTETLSALEWLVRQGYLQRLPSHGSEHLYALNFEKRNEAERFVDQGIGTQGPTDPKE